MEIWIIVSTMLFAAIFIMTVFALNAIATICKHGGVTIRIIQEKHYDNEPTEPAHTMSEEEQKIMDDYNKEQSTFMSSIRNLQSLFVNKDQTIGGDKT